MQRELILTGIGGQGVQRMAKVLALDGTGFSLVEILTTYPTDWFVPPDAGPQWLETNLAASYALRVIEHARA